MRSSPGPLNACNPSVLCDGDIARRRTPQRTLDICIKVTRSRSRPGDACSKRSETRLRNVVGTPGIFTSRVEADNVELRPNERREHLPKADHKAHPTASRSSRVQKHGSSVVSLRRRGRWPTNQSDGRLPSVRVGIVERYLQKKRLGSIHPSRTSIHGGSTYLKPRALQGLGIARRPCQVLARNDLQNDVDIYGSSNSNREDLLSPIFLFLLHSRAYIRSQSLKPVQRRVGARALPQQRRKAKGQRGCVPWRWKVWQKGTSVCNA